MGTQDFGLLVHFIRCARSIAFLMLIIPVVACSTPSHESRGSSEPVILLTSFEPFGKRDTNLSHEVAQRIGKRVKVEICRLPVVYDRAAERAVECYEEMNPKPTLVLSLGEGSCAVRLETAATNWDNAPKMADNAGVLRSGSKIVAAGADRIGFTLPVQEMYCGIPAGERGRVVASISAGNYVCNNTAYRLARYFRDKPVQFGFVHVPHSDCEPAVRDPAKNAEIIAGLIERVLAYDAGPARDSNFPHPSNRVALPATAGELEKAPFPAGVCERDFLKTLARQYPAKN
jgi:pyroglutamyl-peptidase